MYHMRGAIPRREHRVRKNGLVSQTAVRIKSPAWLFSWICSLLEQFKFKVTCKVQGTFYVLHTINESIAYEACQHANKNDFLSLFLYSAFNGCRTFTSSTRVITCVWAFVGGSFCLTRTCTWQLTQARDLVNLPVPTSESSWISTWSLVTEI